MSTERAAPGPAVTRRSRKRKAPSDSTAAFAPSQMLLPQAFLELAPDGIIVAEATGRITLVR
jgi:hypothetical protein